MSIIEDNKEGLASTGRRPTIGLPKKSSPLIPSDSDALASTPTSTADEPTHVQLPALDSGLSAPCGNEAVDDNENAIQKLDSADPVFASTDKQIDTATGSKAAAEAASVDCSLQLAYTSCKAIRELTGEIQTSRWNKRAIEMLPAALAFIDAYKADPNRYENLCILAKNDGIKIPKEGKLKIWLVAVKICMEPGKNSKRSDAAKKKKSDQTEWSRFANVVFVATGHFLKPAEAAEWLSKQTLKDIMDKARAMKKGEFATERLKPVPALLKEHKNIAQLFALGQGPDFDDLSDRLQKALKALDAEVAAKAEAARSLSNEVVS